MADHAELIANFVAVSGATPEQAQFYLEANNWDINVTRKQSSHHTHPQQQVLTFVLHDMLTFAFTLVHFYRRLQAAFTRSHRQGQHQEEGAAGAQAVPMRTMTIMLTTTKLTWVTC